MNNYIVRIYRRGRKAGEKLAGLVEAIESDKKIAFSSADELLEILNLKEKYDGPLRDRGNKV